MLVCTYRSVLCVYTIAKYVGHDDFVKLRVCVFKRTVLEDSRALCELESIFTHEDGNLS